MKISLGTNIASLMAQRRLEQNTSALSGVFERLASGQRINRASDDAAGLAIASSLNANGKVYGQAIRNVNDGLSLLSIADGALSELSNIVTRQSELAEQSANGVYSTQQRQALDTEAQALRSEYARVLATTEFNGRNVFKISNGPVSIQAGYGTQGSLFANYLNIQEGGLEGLGTYTNFDRTYGAGSAMTGLTFMVADMNNDGIDDIVAAKGVDIGGGNVRASFAVYLGENGSTTYTLDAQIGTTFAYFGTAETMRVYAQLTDLGSDGDLDIELRAEVDFDNMGTPGTNFADGNITNMLSGGTFSLASFSDTSPTITNALSGSATGDFNNDGIDDIVDGTGGNVHIQIQDTGPAAFSGDDITQDSISLLSASTARTALDSLNTLLDTLSITRGKVGAIQSRFYSATATLASSRENAGAAEARIMNADIAEESSALVKNSIRNNVTAAILAQANAQPQIALDLLRNV